MRDNSEKKKNTGLLFFMRNPYMKFQDSSFNGLKVAVDTKSVTHIHVRKQKEERSSDFSRITPGLRPLPPRLDPHRSGGAPPPPPPKQFWIHACHFRTCNPPPPTRSGSRIFWIGGSNSERGVRFLSFASFFLKFPMKMK